MNCQEVPAILSAEPRQLGCERLAAAKPGCICEACSVEPAISPGIVDRDERLARFVLRHDFDNSSNVVKPSLFSHAVTIGMSVTRIEHAGQQGLANQQQARDYVGYVDTSCEKVRAISYNGERAFGVYDTAQPDNIAHADVCQTIFRAKSVASEMRRQLLLAFTRAPKSAAATD